MERFGALPGAHRMLDTAGDVRRQGEVAREQLRLLSGDLRHRRFDDRADASMQLSAAHREEGVVYELAEHGLPEAVVAVSGEIHEPAREEPPKARVYVDTRPGDRADDRRIGRARGHRDRVQHLTFGVRCLFGAPEEQHRQSFGQAAHAAHIRERAGVFAFDNDAGPEDPSRRFLDVRRIPAAARDDVGDGLLR